MQCYQGKIDISDRLEKDKKDNIISITKEVFGLINKQLEFKMQRILDYISVNYSELIKNKIYLTISKSSFNCITISDISKLNIGDLIDNTLVINLNKYNTIKYNCISFKSCFEKIISMVPESNQTLTYKVIKNTKRCFICELSLKI
jgi:hypothetical protein